jgi:hypothetical protein
MLKIVEGDEYELLKCNPTKTCENKVVSVLRNCGLDDETRRKITLHYSRTPHIYGLVKVHKENMPLRPIVSRVCVVIRGVQSLSQPMLKNFEKSNFTRHVGFAVLATRAYGN